MKILLSVIALAVPAFAWAAAPSPHAGQESRQIKALSQEERNDLLAGKEMGFALAAELNGYPGPVQVLELNRELALTPDQRSKTEALVKSIERRARNFGRQLVDAEQALDLLFSSKKITPTLLSEALTRIGEIQARLRGSHLEASIEQARILSPEQIAQYGKLRGYAAGGAQGGSGGPGSAGGARRN